MSAQTVPEIGVFPNSGHHYEFVPLDGDLLRLDEFRDFLDACRGERQAWTSHERYPWIRYRPGARLEGQGMEYGFWIAVESNLGPASRGFVYEPEHEVQRRPASEADEKLASPYAYTDEREIGSGPPLIVSLPVKNNLGQVVHYQEMPPIVWKLPAGDPIDVDLVVDFGNTRTIALVFENDQVNQFQDSCKPVRFQRRGTSFQAFGADTVADDPCAVVDSWIVLHETVFSDFWPPHSAHKTTVPTVSKRFEKPSLFAKSREVKEVTHETSYLPQMFVEMSPAILGGGNDLESARHILNTASLEHDSNFFLSSPKRYAWDGEPMGTGGEQHWHVELNFWNPKREELHRQALPRLQGPVLMLMDTDGRHWDIDSPPNERANVAERPHADDVPIHPRRDTLTWAALAVLETAYRQISSQGYRQASGRPFVPRRIRSVLVTFPAGWTAQELDCYRAQWQKAINIFALAHLRRRGLTTAETQGAVGDRPQLITTLDEAVASQLPIIYGAIRSMGGAGESWLELVGRGEGTNAKARILNVDIGGGTTDVAVVEYRDKLEGQQTSMEATLLFKNSSAVAGDTLVKKIIEAVLLPVIGAPFDDDQRARFQRMFRNTPAEWLGQEVAYYKKLSRIVRLVFIPIVNYWLGNVANRQSPECWARDLRDIRDATGQQLVHDDALREFNRLVRKFLHLNEAVDVLPFDKPLPVDPNGLENCVGKVFQPLFQVLGRLIAAFDCDLVLVSGKPSELPEIARLLKTSLPIAFQRLIFAKDYPIGDWYPVGAKDGKVHDAKTPTVVGAALSQAMRSHKIKNWQLETAEAFVLNENYWGLMPEGGNLGQFDRNPFLKPGESSCVKDILVGSYIGRKRYLSPHVAPEQIYRLRWKNRRRFGQSTLTVELTRVAKENASEQLELTKVIGKDQHGAEVTLDDVELQLCTLADAEFWMDRPSFEIEWPHT